MARIRVYRTVVVMATVLTCAGILFVLNFLPDGIESFPHQLKVDKKDNFTAVVVATQMRSGSSLTGEVLQQPSRVFYVYEPLRMLHYLRKNNASIHFLNGTRRRPDEYDVEDVVHQTLIGWLTCDFRSVHKESLLDIQFLSFGKKTQIYAECLKQIQTMPLSQKDLGGCLAQLKTLCLESDYRIIKTIRTPMTSVYNLFSALPQVKVVHLVRDPRSQVASVRKLGGCVDYTTCVYFLCGMAWNDTLVRLALQDIHPTSFYTLQYESLVLEPLTHFRAVYEFLDLSFTEEISSYISSLNRVDINNITCEVCKTAWQIKTRDKEGHLSDWKNVLGINQLTLLKHACHKLMAHYNYS